jgi:hypothetical protein
MDNEMIERLVAIQMKHNPQTKIGATIVVVEMLTAMREPTTDMLTAPVKGGFPLEPASYSGNRPYIWRAMIDAVINEP